MLSYTYAKKDDGPFDHCLLECRNIVHEKMSLILYQKSSYFETFKIKAQDFFSSISQRKGDRASFKTSGVILK